MAERARLESVWLPQGGSGVRIPPSPPNFTFSDFGMCCLGIVFFGDFPRHSQIKGERPPGNAEVRTNLFEAIFLFKKIAMQSDIFGLVGGFYEIYHKFEPIIALLLKIL